MKKSAKRITFTAVIYIVAVICAACGSAPDKEKAPAEPERTKTVSEQAQDEKASETEKAGEDASEEDYTDGLGDTFSGKTQSVEMSEETTDTDDTAETKEIKDVDLIFFMGQSNMSGAGGDASAAPSVSEDAGQEFRAVSDPTRLYPITEPFGINENDPTGLIEYPGAKKGSMVSAFINEYHKDCGRKVIAVSVSMGATDMTKWETEGVKADIQRRFDNSVSYLKNNGYNIGHMYVIWLHGESDAIEGTDPEVYKTALDNIMRPLFIGGLQKVFIITPGRTIDYKDIFSKIIDVQKKICEESAYYAVATTVLTRVSPEYMKDQYHYNQHVLNMVGIESAKAVAYFSKNNKEKIVYDYSNGELIVPEGVDRDSQPVEERIHFTDLDINEAY